MSKYILSNAGGRYEIALFEEDKEYVIFTDYDYYKAQMFLEELREGTRDKFGLFKKIILKEVIIDN